MSINDDTSPTTVSYGGTVIARLEAGQTGTVRCARKRMKADVKIVAGSGGGKPLTVNARVVDVVTSKIKLNLPIEVNAGEVDVVSSRIELKMPIISTNLIVEET